jgi:hypothetical protein
MLEDYYIPVRGGDTTTKIDSVDGLNWTYSGGYAPVKVNVIGNMIFQLDQLNGLKTTLK